jgi:2-dehydro-3-deoxygluconokinase
MKKVVCFGELLLRLTPSISGEWIDNGNIPIFSGGAEANVASALSKWGIPTKFVTALPDNFLSGQLLNYLNQKGLDISSILKCGKRLGTYYLPIGADIKNAEVIYDRENSSFWNLKPGMLDWETILDGVEWFHFSAICPALNQNIANVCEEALKVARSKNIKISVDLNYRAKLWQYGKQPAEIMPNLVEYCDLVMGNIWAAHKMLNTPVNESLNDKRDYLMQSKITSEKIATCFPQCKTVANTFRFTDHNQINYYAILHEKNKNYVSAEYNTNSIIDRVGSGDCFMAGLIYGYMQNLMPQQIINFSAAAAFSKLFVVGDATNKSVEEIEALIKLQND